jgi:hypothetical protein
MTLNEGMRVMLNLEKKYGRGVFTEDTVVVGVARAGSEDCMMVAGRVKDLLNHDFGSPPHALVVPGKLHFLEKEAIQMLGGMRTRGPVSSAEMREIEKRAEAMGVPRLLLMENAGLLISSLQKASRK